LLSQHLNQKEVKIPAAMVALMMEEVNLHLNLNLRLILNQV
jgi:hypothetical protein